MIKRINPTRHKIESSNKDSIATWLDVLTGMLVMSETQRAQVRDELEDHLRSRVDDLLIIGKTESQAIQVAVAELGETAELAKLITHAHTRTHSRRKIMNASLIVVALAGMSFGGFTFITGTNSPAATPNSSGAVPAIVIGDNNKQDEQSHEFNIENASVNEILTSIAEAFGKKFEQSIGASQHPLAGYLASNIGTLKGTYTYDQAISKFKTIFSEGYFQYQIVSTNDTILVQSYLEYQRDQVETRVYPNPSWINQINDQRSYADSLQSLLGVKYDLEFTSIQIIGQSIVVAAPPDIHDEVVKFRAELEKVIGKRAADLDLKRALAEEEMQARNIILEHEFAVRTANQIAKRADKIQLIQIEYDEVREQLLSIKDQISMLRSEAVALDNLVNQNQLTMDDYVAKTTSLNNAQEKLNFELSEIEEKYYYLRTRLLESRYANLFEGLD